MKIVSRFPYLWPHLGFALVAGENEIEESKIPLAAHAKLAHLSKPGRDETGKVLPAPISGYEPSKALADAADKHFGRKSKVKDPVLTLETSGQAQPTAEASKPESGEQRRDVTGQHPNQKR